MHLLWKSDKQTNERLVGELAYPELADLRNSIPEIDRVALIPAALYGNGRVLQIAGEDPVQIETCPASTDFFRVLGTEKNFTLELKDGESAAICSTDDGYGYVIMPLARDR